MGKRFVMMLTMEEGRRGREYQPQSENFYKIYSKLIIKRVCNTLGFLRYNMIKQVKSE